MCKGCIGLHSLSSKAISLLLSHCDISAAVPSSKAAMYSALSQPPASSEIPQSVGSNQSCSGQRPIVLSGLRALQVRAARGHRPQRSGWRRLRRQLQPQAELGGARGGAVGAPGRRRCAAPITRDVAAQQFREISLLRFALRQHRRRWLLAW